MCRSVGGSITPITGWLQCADHALAPLCRSPSGSYVPVGDSPVGMDYLHGQGIQSADIATDPVAAVGRIGAALENLAPEAREQFDRLAHATLRKHDLLQAA